MGFDGRLSFDTSLDVSGFKNGLSKLGGIASRGISAVAKLVGGASAAVGGLATAAVNAGMTFESSMSKVASISGASADELERLTKKAQEMGIKTKYSASEAGDAMSYMAMAGWKTEEMLNGVSGVMNLAAASGEDLAAVSDIVTDALTAFGMSAKDSTRFADVLAAASANSNTNVGLMGETFKYVAPVAGALGYSIEDTAQAIGLMANAGIKGSMAGTALRSLLTRLSKPTNEVKGAMQELGLSMTHADGSMKTLGEQLTDLRSGFKNLSKDQRAQYAATLASQEGMSGLLAIVQASDADFEKLSNSILTANGSAEKMAETMNDNLQGAITLAKSSLEGFGIAVYDNLKYPLRDAVKDVTESINGVATAVTNGGLSALPDALGQALGELALKAAEQAPALIDSGVQLINAFVTSIAESDALGEAGADIVAALTNGIIQVSGTIAEGGLSLLTALLESFALNSEETGQAVGELISGLISSVEENAPRIKEAAKTIIQNFCEGLSEEFPGVSALLSGFAEGFLDTLYGISETVGNILGDAFDVLNSADPEALKGVGEALGTIAAALLAIGAAKTAITTIGGVFKALASFPVLSGVVGIIKGIAEGLPLLIGGAGTFSEVFALEFPKAAAIVSGALGKISAMLSGVGGFLSSAAGVAKTAIGALTSTFGGIASVVAGAVLAVTSFVDMLINGFDVVKNILMAVGIALTAVGAVILGAPAVVAAAVAGIVYAVASLFILIKDNWDAIVEWFKGLPAWFADLGTTISEFFQGIGERIGEFFRSIPEKMQELGYAIGEGIGSIILFFMSLPEKIGDAFSSAAEAIAGWGRGVLQWVTITVPQIISNIVSFFADLPGKIWQWLLQTISRVVSFGSSLVSAGIKAARDFASNFVSAIASLPSKMVEIGANIVRGIWNGIKNMGAWIKKSIGGFFGGIVDGIKDTLGIHSPSTVLEKEVGQWIPPGVGVGVKKAMPALNKQVTGEMADLGAQMRAVVLEETGRVNVIHEARGAYQAATESTADGLKNLQVQGTLTSEQPIELHSNIYLDKKVVAREITPAVNREMYKIDKNENNRGEVVYV